ncbi:hypothetical protein SEEH2823_14117 [Salmonella enterica subsp. enterica serovar Heidelberg str. 77-2823]|nr:hypothetical protein CFSAN00325_14672 [Salmonella enterica subsp. enterica serovar Heidelberg str. CFSAN00325]EJW31393.1 hypothetical protein CFSAN00326_04194 [Salmonella enterica subsp. enterica serovar Heidelberg str. CFSAN00326]EJW36598.1 hypothetical protein CFSAN00328_18247 [Salmonella enterica subsp. enterica serovar Heidelberg str. CFSAN00328]ELX21908.1 hypothetical protein SE451200_17715 [Salmonella enterica subsp. enterica serovar 4 [Salmonella enterica subsp. enterica serovar 4 [Sal
MAVSVSAQNRIVKAQFLQRTLFIVLFLYTKKEIQ